MNVKEECQRLPGMIETSQNVGYFSSKFEKLFDRSDRQIDVQSGHEIDESVTTVTIEGQEITAKNKSKKLTKLGTVLRPLYMI